MEIIKQMAISVTNRNVLQLAASTFEAIKALSDADVVQSRELLSTSDTHQLILGNGDDTITVFSPNYIENDDQRAIIESSAGIGAFFYAKDTKKLYIRTDTSFELATPDLIAELANYIQKVSGGTENNLVSLTADGSIQDSGYKVNDLGTETTDLWSAQKTQQAINDALSGLSWQKPVKNTTTTDVSADPTKGDRYLILQEPSGAWVGKKNYIAEFDGTEWKFYEPVDGAAVWDETADKTYSFNGTDWIDVTASMSISAGDGLEKSDSTIAVKPKTDSGIDVSVDGVAVKIKQQSGLTVSAEGIAADVDGTSVVFDGTGKLSIKHLDFGTF